MHARRLGIAILLAFGLVLIAQASTPDYQGMVDRIEVLLKEGLEHYRNGAADKAKAKVQDAYFRVFENLEGPIRINVSARKNYELESEFGDIRKQILRGDPIAKVEERINWLIGELEAVLPELEDGHVLVAEGTYGDAEPPAATTPETEAPAEPAAEAPVNSTWRKAADDIASQLDSAVAAYRNGDGAEARRLIIQAQFRSYKNTLLETAIRRHESQSRDAEHNAAFSAMITQVKTDEGPDALQRSAAALVQAIESDLPGLPLVEGAEVMEGSASEEPAQDWAKVSKEMLGQLQTALAVYRENPDGDASGQIQDIYFDVFEASGMEGAIAARNASLKATLEAHFARMVGQMKKGAAVGEVEATLAAMQTDLDSALELLGSGGESPWTLFLYSLLIILREGFEAILVVTALMTYLVKTGHRDKLGVVYNSVILALVLSFITAVLLEWVFKASAASQEILEGVTMLIAAAVLFTISYWLISKAEAQKWMAYIKQKVEGSLSTGSMVGLWFASFLAVYREGAETVLFYKALTVGAGPSGNMAVLAGFLVGLVGLIAIYWIMWTGAVRLPLRSFFMATGALLYLMAFVFAGKGMMELVEGKLFEPSLIAGLPEIPALGIYPYWETLAPQILLIVLAIGAFFALSRKGKVVAQSA